jgi:predicted acylesterase/phospholipase RssA
VTSEHTPSLAAGKADPSRSLLLAGGGIRVAYQSGVLIALEDAGLRFSHIDGASGGTITLAMLLSGLSPGQCCDRWRSLPVRWLATPPPLRRLLRGPPYPALTGSAGLRRTFDHLGVDPVQIRRARGVAGTFNVCDFTTKRNVVVDHEHVDEDMLLAAVSLPMVSPAVKHSGATYVDSVWIKDTNVAEAVARGAEELWLVWCIGNHGRYRDGQFQQYVHMIEIAANGSLFEQLDRVAEANQGRPRPIRLHVIRPEYPLPLDLDYLLGRIDATTLIAMGHRDAWRYVDAYSPDGVALDAEATRMRDPVPGVSFREQLGEKNAPLRVHLGWEIVDLDAFLKGDRRGTLVGAVDHPSLAGTRFARSGRFRLEGRDVTAELDLGDGLVLDIRRALNTFRRVELQLRRDGAPVSESVVDAPAPWRTLHARGVASFRDGAVTLGRFLRWAVAVGVR